MVAKTNRSKDCWNRVGVGGDRSCPELAEHVHCRNCPTYSAAGRALLEREAPPEYLAEWQRRLAVEKESGAADTTSVLVFRLAEEWFALPARGFRRVADERPTHRVPHRSNAVFTGLVNVEGELLPCFSLSNALEIEGTSAAKAAARILVLEREGELWACRVDEVGGVIQLESTAIGEVPVSVAKSSSALARAVASWNGTKVAMLDDEALCRRLRQSMVG
jgi:chemotaxis-related protein WspD